VVRGLGVGIAGPLRPAELELRRRQSLERVRGLLVAEDTVPALGR